MSTYGQFVIALETRPAITPSADIVREEERFYDDPRAAERNYGGVFLKHRAYIENAFIISGPLPKMERFINLNGCNVPDDVRKEAGEEMAKRVTAGATFSLPHREGVSVQAIYSIARESAEDFLNRKPEDATHDAVVFNTRFQLGYEFTYHAFLAALNNFLTLRPARTAKMIKIAWWSEDIAENHALLQTGGAELTSDDNAIGKIELLRGLSEQVSSVSVFAFEMRTMNETELERQRSIHSLPATEQQLARITSILDGPSEPL